MRTQWFAGGGARGFGSVFAVLTDSANTIATTVTLVNRFSAANFDTVPSAGPKKVRAILQGPFSSAWIGQAVATAGDPNFAAAPTQLLVGGVGSSSQSLDSPVLTDVATFTWDGVSDIMIALDGSTANTTFAKNEAVIGAKSTLIFKFSAVEASSMTKTGYTTLAASVYIVSAIEIDGCTVLAPQSTRSIVCDGNSLTLGIGPIMGSYPSQLFFKSRYGAKTFNVGVSGATTPQRQAANSTGPLFVPGAVAVLWEVTNDIKQAGLTAAAAVANYWSWCDAVRAQGFKVVAATVLPRNDAGTPVGFETSRQSANSLIIANWNLHADALADIGADPTIGAAGAYSNATYYQADLVHLTAPGYDIVSNIVKTAMATLP